MKKVLRKSGRVAAWLYTVVRNLAFGRADDDFRFAAAVAAFGMLLNDSSHKGDATLEWVRDQGRREPGERSRRLS